MGRRFRSGLGRELTWLHEQCPDEPLIFGGPGKLDRELDIAMQYSISAFHVESVTELRSLARIARQRGVRAALMLRLNLKLTQAPQSRLVMGGKPTPFGLDEQGLASALQLLREEPSLELKGLHFHMLSHQLDVDAHLELIRSYFLTFRQLCVDHDLQLPVLNVGGGMGINYQNPAQSFDWPRFCQGLKGWLMSSAWARPESASKLVALSAQPAAITSCRCWISKAATASFCHWSRRHSSFPHACSARP